MKMKDRFAIAVSLVITLACGCFDNCQFDNREYEKLAAESSVVVHCKNHVKEGLIWAEISEVWRDESKGKFTNKVSDLLETHVPVDPPTDCGETAIMFFGRLGNSLINYNTLYVHDGKVDGDVSVERFKSLIQATHYSGGELEIPNRTSGGTQRR